MTLRFEDEQYSGVARVEAVWPMAEGVRYGLQSVSKHRTKDELRAGLRHMVTAIQRRQLQRRARG